MKKTLIILILVLAYQFANAQVKVLGKIEPNGPTDKYPTHVDSLGRGGLMTAASWQERNAIPAARRKAGMLVRVKSASVDSTYTLGMGLTNADWTAYVPTVNITNLDQIATRSYNDLQDKPIIPDDAQLLHTTGAETKNGNLTLMGPLILPNNNQVSFSSVNNSYSGYLRGDGMQFSNLSGNIITNLSNDGIRFRYNGSGETVLRGQTISSGTTAIQLPSASGTLALTSDIPDMNIKANLSGGNTFNGSQIFNGNSMKLSGSYPSFVFHDTETPIFSSFKLDDEGFKIGYGSSESSSVDDAKFSIWRDGASFNVPFVSFLGSLELNEELSANQIHTSGLNVGGVSKFSGIKMNYKTYSANTTLSADDYFVSMTTSGTTVTLPASNSDNKGTVYEIMCDVDYYIYVNVQGGQTIFTGQGFGTTNYQTVTDKNEVLKVVSTGSGWRILNSYYR